MSCNGNYPGCGGKEWENFGMKPHVKRGRKAKKIRKEKADARNAKV